MRKNIILKAISMVIMSMVTINAYCVPAKKTWHTMTLTDGTTVETMLIGDEHGHWYIDHYGNALKMTEKGGLSYMTAEEFSKCKEQRSIRAKASNERRMARIEKTRKMAAESTKRKVFGSPTTITGEKRGLVILVSFSDVDFFMGNTQDVFERRFNEKGYNENGYVGSVHDYFYDQSYGLFDITFDVIGPVKVSNTCKYYGENDGGSDKHPAEMVIEALQLADDFVNYKDYDWDGDNKVDQVFIIYAGTSEASSGKDDDIWPHEWDLSSAAYYGDGNGAQTLDGVVVDTYAVSGELASDNSIDGIGTACHEFSHCLGYADLYDVDYSGGQGMMSWDLMDGGSYNGPKDMGEVPAGYTSFERWWAGWLKLEELKEPGYVTDMPDISDEPVAYVIYNDNNKNEYYLLENRQGQKWDKYTGGHGMMILHVDYNRNVWMQNSPNNDPNRQRMTYFPADNSYGTKYSYGGQSQWGATTAQLAGDPFPGTKKKHEFTDTSAPAATLYNKNKSGQKLMGKPITEIEEIGGLISFTFMGGIPTPEATEATDIDNDKASFTANWNAVDGIDSYDLEVTEIRKSSSKPVYSADFTDVAAAGSNTDISSRLSEGWEGFKVFYYMAGILKIGSSSNAGYIMTPEIGAPTSGKVTVKFTAKGHFGDNATTNVSIGNSVKTVKLADDFTDYIVNYDNVTDNFNVKFTMPQGKRMYIDKIEVYDGEYTLDDLVNDASAKAMSKAAPSPVIYSGITETSYVITDLETKNEYKYRVRSVKDDKHSSWSDYINVQFAEVTAIPTLTADKMPGSQRIHNLNGQYVGTDISRLPRGIYIIGTHKVVKE